MSSGPFLRALYETDLGNIVGIRIQPETAALTLNAVANDQPTGTPAAGFPSAQSSQSRRAIGINARTVTIAYDTGASAGLEGLTVSLPWLQATSFDALPNRATGTYQSEPVVLVSKAGELIR